MTRDFQSKGSKSTWWGMRGADLEKGLGSLGGEPSLGPG